MTINNIINNINNSKCIELYSDQAQSKVFIGYKRYQPKLEWYISSVYLAIVIYWFETTQWLYACIEITILPISMLYLSWASLHAIYKPHSWLNCWTAGMKSAGIIAYVANSEGSSSHNCTIIQYFCMHIPLCSIAM